MRSWLARNDCAALSRCPSPSLLRPVERRLRISSLTPGAFRVGHVLTGFWRAEGELLSAEVGEVDVSDALVEGVADEVGRLREQNDARRAGASAALLASAVTAPA